MAKSKLILKRIALSLGIVLMLLFLFFMLIRNNIHTVKRNILYRSAQLSTSRFKRLIRVDHIRTIINLRGSHPQCDWYRDELTLSQSMGVKHYDIPLSAVNLPTAAQLNYLLKLYQTAPKPILLHCEGGADRTGFAVAMWLLMQGHSLTEAKQAFSIRYFVHRSDTIGKLVMPFYERWLERHHIKTSSKNFMLWATSTKLSNAE